VPSDIAEKKTTRAPGARRYPPIKRVRVDLSQALGLFADLKGSGCSFTGQPNSLSRMIIGALYSLSCIKIGVVAKCFGIVRYIKFLLAVLEVSPATGVSGHASVVHMAPRLYLGTRRATDGCVDKVVLKSGT